MTERGPFTGMRGAPDPAEPSNPGEARAPASGPPDTVDLGAVRRTDALIDSLAARRAAGSAARPHPGAEAGRPRQAEEPDPAVRLLRALLDDVDDPGCGRDAGPEAAPPAPPPSGPGPRRRGPRTIVALGVAGAVLASTGVAAAGSVADHSTATSAAPAPRPSAGTPGDAEQAVRTDTDAGTYERPRAPSPRPAPEPEHSTPAPAEPPEGREGDRPRTRHPFPFGPRSPQPDFPTMAVNSDPAPETETPAPDRRDLHKHRHPRKRTGIHDRHDRPRD